MKQDRRMRRRDAVFPFGVGAIMDFLGDSFIAEDTRFWPGADELPRIECDSLRAVLDGAELRGVPVIDEEGGRKQPAVPFSRFPRWRFCAECSRMTRHGLDTAANASRCPQPGCGGALVPMRFLAVCEEGGHVQDIDWGWWVHGAAAPEGREQCRKKRDLRVVRRGEGSGQGLSSVMIRCDSCRASRSLGELSDSECLSRAGMRCLGRQPWEPEEAASQNCASPLRCVLRTSTAVHRSMTVSALDIPWGETTSDQRRSAIRTNAFFKLIKDGRGDRDLLMSMLLDEVSGATIEDVELALGGASPSLVASRALLADREWAALTGGGPCLEEGDGSEFRMRRARPMTATRLHPLADLISGVGLVERLREVIALEGFVRYKQKSPTRVDLWRTDDVWYPAVESFGEGILISLNEDRVAEWSRRPAVRARAEMLAKRADSSGNPFASGIFGPPPTPRFILLHTLSHLLIDRFEFHSGYTAASLRERVYAGEGDGAPQAGILIYTTSGDSAGTMGGLVRLGEPEFLPRILLTALEGADSCANDPVCAESTGQGPDALNLAACHACALVSETSCTRGNVLLDRGLVIGADGVPGYFEPVLEEARRMLFEV